MGLLGFVTAARDFIELTLKNSPFPRVVARILTRINRYPNAKQHADRGNPAANSHAKNNVLAIA